MSLDGPWLSLPEGARVGACSSNAKFIWSPDGKPPDFMVMNTLHASSLVRTARIKKVLPMSGVIVAGYQWDYLLEALWPPERYRMRLTQWVGMGITSVVQYDFSVFYQDPEAVRSRNLWRNFVMLQEAQRAGFRTVLNFNNILAWHFSLYRKILKPPVPTMVIDANHVTHEKRFLPLEIQSLRFCIEELGVRDILLWSNSKRQIQIEVAAKGATVHRVPVEWTFVRMKNDAKGRGQAIRRVSGGEQADAGQGR